MPRPDGCRSGRVALLWMWSPEDDVNCGPVRQYVVMDRGERFWAWVVRRRFQFAGVAALLVGLALSVWLAFAASSETPPSASQSALLVVIGAIFNAGGALLFARRPGEPNLGASRMAARHLAQAGESVALTRSIAEDAFDDGTAPRLRAAVGELSVRLSVLEQQLDSNLKDWAESYPDLVPTRPEPVVRNGESETL